MDEKELFGASLRGALFKIGQKVVRYGDVAEIVEIEPRRAGGPMYRIKYHDGETGWSNEHETDEIEAQ